MGFLDSLFGLNAGDPNIQAADKNRTAVDAYGTTASNLIDTGAATAGTNLTNADNLAQLGLNAVGTSYTASPGYQYGLDQGITALERTAAARGGLGGGQLGGDILDYATGAASKDYGDWLTQLQGAIGTGIGTQDNLASLATGTASAKTGVAGDVLNGNLGANNQQASGEATNAAGLSNLFGEVVGGGLSALTGGLSGGVTGALAGLGKYVNPSSGGSGTTINFGYGGF